MASFRASHHAGGAPEVGWGAIVSSYQDLHRAVLTRLDVLCEVFVLENRSDCLIRCIVITLKKACLHQLYLGGVSVKYNVTCNCQLITHHPAGVSQVCDLYEDLISILWFQRIHQYITFTVF